jgi:hypothetical protein
MKKLISIIAAAALVFALAVPAMAATSSPSPSGGDVVSSASSTSDDYLVRILPAAPTQEELSALSARAAEIGGEAEYSTDCVNVEIVNHAGAVVTSQYFQENTAVLVSFVRNDAREVLAVLAWNAATHTWDSVSFIQDGSSVFATLPHLCNIAFVVKGLEDGSASSSTAGSATDSGAAAGTAADGTTSAQTGYTAIVWIALAVVAVAGACICFRTSKRSAVSAA